MSRERLKIPTNTDVSFHNGGAISVRKIETFRINPGSVAIHEAVHTVAAGTIVSATIVPSEDALGTTIPTKMTAQAAAAPAALGYEGVGHDLAVVEYGLGKDVESAKAGGRAAVLGQEDVIDEVAVLLEERKTIGQPDVDEARQNVRKRREGIYPVEVAIQSTHGELQVHETESYHDKVLIPGEWLELDKAA